MEYKYKHFIPQNTAPNGAKKIGVYDANGNKVLSILLGGLTPTKSEKLYSFGLLSDTHILRAEIPPNYMHNTKFDNALSYFESKGCSFCVVCGDVTQTGFYRSPDDTTANAYYDEILFQNYKSICDKHIIADLHLE